MLAADNGTEVVIRFLLQSDAIPNQPGPRGITALKISIRSKRKKAAAMLRAAKDQNVLPVPRGFPG